MKSRAKKMMENVKIPERFFANASPLSIGGASMFDSGVQINVSTVESFYSENFIINNAVNKLQRAGFEILQISRATINIAGSLETFQKAFNTRIVPSERPVIKRGNVKDTATFWDSVDTEMKGLISVKDTPFADVLEGVAIEEPRYYMGPSMLAPTKAYWHLRVPGDVSLGCNADQAHRLGITGKDVKVSMVDSGWYQHPYFTSRGYRVSPVVLAPGAVNPSDDESGHGTGESANIFALAPDVQLLPVKMSFVNSLGAFNTAVSLGPDIITCSWGSSIKNGPLSAADQALAAAIASAVISGIIVVFSAGNGHYGFPGQHPDVISAGGVYMLPDGTLQASDYASGFMSQIYTNRRVPDLCGLVGMSPGASYIMLPIHPGMEIDTSRAGGVFPPNDETDPNDGWAVFSGTSAAAPQLAGACALLKQACTRLKPDEIREILTKSARDVTVGTCSSSTGGYPAGVGPDLATGSGLVDAHRAVLMAKVRCLGILSGAMSSLTVEARPGPIPPAPVLSTSAPTIPAVPNPYLSRDDITAIENMILGKDNRRL